MTDDIDQLTRQWIRPQVRAMSAYHVPDPGRAVKLDAMENPYTWPRAVVDAWLERLRPVALNRYPDPAAGPLKRAMAEAMGVPEGMEVLLGNGSDELIQMILMAVAGPDRTVLAPEPTFVMYRVVAELLGMGYRGVPLGAGFALERESMLAAIAEHEPAVVFLAYPNNPTGNLFDNAAVEAVVRAAPGLVVLDEAYAAFAGDTWMPALGRHPNLLVLRTVSKMGLAGLRLGMLAGPSAWLAEIDKTRLPYNVNVLTQASAEFALSHRGMLDDQTRRIRADRGALLEALAALPGVQPFPSEANFILFRVPAGRGDAVFDGLRARGVLIKNLNGAGGALTDCLRVTVGTPEENAAFLEALAAVLVEEKT